MDEKDSENGISDIQNMKMVIQKIDTPTGLSYLFNFTLDKQDRWKMEKEMEMMENEIRKEEKKFTKLMMAQSKLKKIKTTGASYLNFTLAAFAAGGGLAGYVKAKSMPSLIAGFGLSALYAGSGVLINNGSCANGHFLAFLTSVGLVGEMGSKAIKYRGKPIPTALSVVGALAAYCNFKDYKFWLIDEHMAPLNEKMQEQLQNSNKQRNSNKDTLKLLESIRRRSNDDHDRFDQTRIDDNNNDDDTNELKNEQVAEDIK